MPRYRVLKGFHREKDGTMVKAGKTFFHEHEALDKTTLGKNKLARVSDEDEDRVSKKKKGKKGKKKSKKSKRKAEEDESSDGGEELAKQTRRDKKKKKSRRNR